MNELPIIDKAFIIDNVSYSSYLKGLEYYNNGYIKLVKVIDENTILAQVEGTNLYDVEIKFYGNNFKASCNCPYELNDYCKHIAATLIYIMNNYVDIQIQLKNIQKNNIQNNLKYNVENFIKNKLSNYRLDEIIISFFQAYPTYFKQFEQFSNKLLLTKEVLIDIDKDYYDNQKLKILSNLISAFQNADFYNKHNFISNKNYKIVIEKGNEINNFSEVKKFFQQSCDNFLQQYYLDIELELKTGNIINAIINLLAIYEFSKNFQKIVNLKIEKVIFDILSEAISFHCYKSFNKIVEIITTEKLECHKQWIYDEILLVYFSLDFNELLDRVNKFKHLKNICSNYESVEFILNFVQKFLIPTNKSVLLTNQNAHEFFYLLNLCGEREIAIKIAKKYLKSNILLYNEYVVFLMKNFEHKKAYNLSLELINFFNKNPEKIKNQTQVINQGNYLEFKLVLSNIVEIINQHLTIKIRHLNSKTHKIKYYKVLYNAFYLQLVYNNDLECVIKLLNIINEITKLNKSELSIENFCESIMNENVINNLFKAKIFKLLNRKDLVLTVASNTKDNYVFMNICSLIMNEYPDDVFNIFKIRLENLILNIKENDILHLQKLIKMLLKIPNKTKEAKIFITTLESKIGKKYVLLP